MEKFNRSSRVKNWSLGESTFVPEIPTEDYIPPEIALANLSESGVGLWIQDTRVYLPPGMVIKGEIRTPDLSFKVELKIIRQNHYIYGCNFTKPVPELAKYLNSQYRIEKTANNMIRVNENFLAPRPEGTPHWHSDGFSELYYIDNDEMVMYYRISYQDSEIERIFDPASHFKNIKEKSGLYKTEFKEVNRFINHINELPPSVRKQIINDLESVRNES